ncbi:tetratricopeptide repeat protein [Coleofasciculus chthonoplastes]|uniref:tetratricopeptide repeat protein n=1 Tax=Coleofasciculus chthonoplastes TaxID=64178 RepID=UPI0032FB9495
MRIHLTHLSFATLLLWGIGVCLPPTLSLSPVVAQAQTTHEQETQADRLFQTGTEQFRQGQLKQALQTYQQALTIHREQGNPLPEAETLNQLGEVYNGLSQYTQAQEVLQQALTIFRQQQHSLGEGLALNHLGESYRNLGQLQTALKHHEQALAIMGQLDNRTQEAATLHNIASVYEIQGQYENAIKFYEQALAIQRKEKDRLGEGRSLIGLGNTYIHWKRYQNSLQNADKDLKLYQDALQAYEQALVIMRELGDSPQGDNYAARVGESWSLNGLGMAYASLNTTDAEDVLKFYEQALVIMREVGNRAGEATVLFNIGRDQRFQGQFDRFGESQFDPLFDPIREYRQISLDFYEQALAIVREIGYRPLEAEILKKLGDRGEKWEIKLEFYQQAFTVVREVRNSPLTDIILRNISRSYNALGYLQTAQEYREQALAIRRELGIKEDPSPWQGATLVTYRKVNDKLTLVTRLEGEAVIYYEQGDAHANRQRYQAALESYQQALTIVRQQGNRSWEWVILNQIGKAYQGLEQLQPALAAYQQSVVIRREVYKQAQQEPIPYTIRVANLVHSVSRNYTVEGILLEEAISNGVIRLGEGEPITTPIKITEGLTVTAGWRDSSDFSLQNEEEETLTNLGDIYQMLGQYQAALKPYEEALAIVREETDGNYHEQGQIIFKQMGKVYEKLGQHQAALESYQQALKIANGENAHQGQIDQIPILLTQIGKAYETLEQYQAALESYQKALKIAQENRIQYRIKETGYRQAGIAYEKPNEEVILNSIGTVYEKLGQPQLAQDYREQAFTFKRNMGNPPEEITIGKAILLTEIGKNENQQTLVQVHRLEGESATLVAAGNTANNQAALESYQQALAIVRQQSNRPWEGIILHLIGSVYEKRGQNQAALESYQQALAFIQEIDNHPGEQATLLMLYGGGAGDIIDIRSESGKVTTFNRAGGVILWTPEAEELLIKIGDSYKSIGQNQAALKSYEQALELVLKNEELKLLTEEEVRSKIASVYNNSQYQAALESYQELLANPRNSENSSLLNKIGTVYKNLGQYQAALESYEQALAIIRKQKQRLPNFTPDNKEGIILNNVGAVYEDLGQYQAALESYQQALTIVRSLNGRGTTLINIGSVYEKMGQHQAALASFQQALAVARGINSRPAEGIILINIGQVYDRVGQPQAALDAYQQALAIVREVDNRAGEGWALNNIGEAYSTLGQYQTALEYYQQALAIREEVGDRAGKGVTLYNIGAALEAQNKLELAIIFYKQSVQIREEIRRDIQGLPQDQQDSYTQTIAEDYRHLADVLLQQNRILEAQRVLDLLKVQELEDYLRNVRGNQATAQGVINLPPEQQFKDNYQAKFIDQAIALGKELTQLRQKTNRTPKDEQRLVELVNTQEQIIADFNTFIESEDVEALIAQLTPKTRKPDLVDDLEDLIGLQDNLKNLQQNAVLLYPLILNDRIELILTTPDSPPIRRTVPITKTQLNQAIVDFRQALKNPTINATPPAQKLYNWLIKPLENDLAAAAAETIIYAPDGQLRYIPLAALHDGEQWLVQRYRINNITAASLTELNTQPKTQLKILAGAFTRGSYSFTLGQERFDFGGLPYAGVEVETLAETVPNTTQLFDHAFNPEDTKPKMGDYNVLHFATHGAIVLGTPEDSFILFGDGTPVTIADVRNWNLNNVDLVVLSACETGLDGNLGTGAEILGLGYQMQRAGARASLASLWTVDDGGTQALMNAFYAAWQGEAITKAEALRQAQIALITGDYTALGEQRGARVAVRVRNGLKPEVVNRLSHPYYWAPFILIGNGL